MKPVNGSTILHTPRVPTAEDSESCSVWCGGCARWLDVQLPHQTAEGVLNEHAERVHGQLGLFPVTDACRFRGPEWDDLAQPVVRVADCA